MESIILPIYNLEGKEVDRIELDSAVFDGKVNKAVIYQVACGYLANQRRGLASTKTRGEVSGSGRKPWRQKGTGRSRHGSIRSPLWTKGGVVFGPHPRSYRQHIPLLIKLNALKSVLNARLNENNVKIIDNLYLDKPRAKELIKALSALDLYDRKKRPASLLLLTDKMEDNLKKAGSNLKFLEIVSAKDVNLLQVLKAKKIIVTRNAWGQVVERLKRLK